MLESVVGPLRVNLRVGRVRRTQKEVAMTQITEYLTDSQSALMDAIYRAISRYKTNRMWTPNGQEIASYAEFLYPDLGT